jgi:acyl carrier protein
MAALAAMEPQDAVRAVAETLARLLAGVLHMDEQDLDHDRRLDEYGLDSLMLAEMLVSLRTRFDIDIPPLELLRSGGTITDISHLVLLRLGLTDSPSAAAGSAEPAEADSVSRVRGGPGGPPSRSASPAASITSN